MGDQIDHFFSPIPLRMGQESAAGSGKKDSSDVKQSGGEMKEGKGGSRRRFGREEVLINLASILASSLLDIAGRVI